MPQEELLLQLHQLEQQSQQLEQYLQILEQQSVMMKQLHLGIDDVKKGVGKEVLAPLAKDVYIKTELKSDIALVDIGGGNFIQRDLEEVKSMLAEKITTLNELKRNLLGELEQVNSALQHILAEVEKQESEQL